MWNARALSQMQMCSFVSNVMFENLYYTQLFQVDQEALLRFSIAIHNNYRDVPYHNWPHAFSVAHCFFSIARTCNLDKYLLPHEIYAHLIATLVRDYKIVFITFQK